MDKVRKVAREWCSLVLSARVPRATRFYYVLRHIGHKSRRQRQSSEYTVRDKPEGSESPNHEFSMTVSYGMINLDSSKLYRILGNALCALGDTVRNGGVPELDASRCPSSIKC